MIRIALCDDESKILDEVSQYINKYADKKNIQSLEVFPFDSARSLKNELDDDKSFDIFVLDVYIGKEMYASRTVSYEKTKPSSKMFDALGRMYRQIKRLFFSCFWWWYWKNIASR